MNLFAFILGRGWIPRFQGRHGNQRRSGEELFWNISVPSSSFILYTETITAQLHETNLSYPLCVFHRASLACWGPVERMALRVLKADPAPMESQGPLVLLEKRYWDSSSTDVIKSRIINSPSVHLRCFFLQLVVLTSDRVNWAFQGCQAIQADRDLRWVIISVRILRDVFFCHVWLVITEQPLSQLSRPRAYQSAPNWTARSCHVNGFTP